ncbi:MAG: class I SAM-dependent methyltransferase [Phycisphaerae bacterium]|nr:class I SAM-dependent methyltransferase [Phycisphaerae bacterium]MCZ2400933.1 class I SAM-dependent methyltransferase [Phycisphaerae bacterium]
MPPRNPDPTIAPSLCIACGRTPRAAGRLPGGAALLQCPRCRLAWWPWPAFDPAALYDRDYFQCPAAAKGYADYASLEPGLRRTARARLRRVERLIGADAAPLPPPRILEIGCGVGVFLDEARRRGWEAAGLEVSAYAAEEARRRGLDVQCAAIEDARLEHGRYDCVALWDVIEHLRDPRAALARAADALRTGGVLALSTGDVTSLCARLSGPRWHLFNLPEHLFFFSPAALRQMLAAAGCRVHRMTREVYWAPLSYLSERACKTLGGAPAARPAGGWVRGWLAPATLLDVLGVYAVRG